MGGFGSAVLEAISELGLEGVRARIHAVPDQFVEHGPQAFQRATFGLDAEGVVAKVLAAFPDLAEAAGPEGRAEEKPARPAEAIQW